MPNTMLTRIRTQDTDVWRTATRSAPVAVQFVWATVFGVGWLLGRLPIEGGRDFQILVAGATIIATIVSLLIGRALLGAESPRQRGLGLAVGGTGLTVLISGLVYAVIFLPLMEPGL